MQAEEQQNERLRRRKRIRIIFVLAAPVLLVMILLLGYGLLERNLFRPKVDPTVERRDMRVRTDEHIQINVLNACGAEGVAKQVTEFLRARKFDVPEYGNAEHIEAQSKVIDRVGDSVSALKVAYALGIAPSRVLTEIDSSLFLRATVVIGTDYRNLRPMK